MKRCRRLSSEPNVGRGMKNTGSSHRWLGGFILALTFLVAISPLSGFAAEKSQATTVEVQAEGQVLAKPDTAILNFTVVTRGAQAQEAAQANAKAAESFLAAIKKTLGKEDKVQTLE